MDNKNIQLEIALRAKLEDIRLLDNWRLDLPGRVCLCGEECIMSGDCIRRKLMVGFDPSKHHKDREITYIKNLSGEFSYAKVPLSRNATLFATSLAKPIS